MYDCVIKGGRVATASDDFDADIAIQDGRIAAIGNGLAPDGWRDAFEAGLRGYLAYVAFDGSVHNTCRGCCCPEDGSIAAYMRREHVLNDAHAHGPAALAFTQAHCIGMTGI